MQRHARAHQQVLANISAGELVVNNLSGSHLECVGQRVGEVDLAGRVGEKLRFSRYISGEHYLAGVEERLQPPDKFELATRRVPRLDRDQVGALELLLPQRLHEKLIEPRILDAD